MNTDLTKFTKIHYPTREVFHYCGDLAIQGFEDNYSRSSTKSPEKNDPHLVVVLESDVAALGETSRREGPDSLGAKDALKYLLSIQRPGVYSDVNEVSEAPVHVGNNLHVLLSREKDIDTLVARQDFRKVRNRLDVIGMHPDEVILHQMRGHRASQVNFVNVNTNIRKEGIKIVEDASLYNELRGVQAAVDEERLHKVSVNQSVPLSRFEEHITRPLYNQYIIVKPDSGKSRGIPLVVTGDMEGKPRGSHFKISDPYARIIATQDFYDASVMGVKPRDVEQMCLLHALRQPHIQLALVTGGSSSGKTLFSLAVALEQTLLHMRDGSKEDSPKYDSQFERIFLTKTYGRIGGEKDKLGFKPGDVNAKLAEYMASYEDAYNELKLRFKNDPDRPVPMIDLVEVPEKIEDGRMHDMRSKDGKRYFSYKNDPPIVPADYTAWRGRTLKNAVAIFEEAQNSRPVELKSILERIGERSLMIGVGDYDGQIDDVKLNALTNGLFFSIRHFMSLGQYGRPYVAIINLEGAYRSWMSEDARKTKVYR